MTDTREEPLPEREVVRQAEEERIPQVLLRSRITRDLLTLLDEGVRTTFPVLIELNNTYPGGVSVARAEILRKYLEQNPAIISIDDRSVVDRFLSAKWQEEPSAFSRELHFAASDRINVQGSLYTDQYVFGDLTAETIKRLAADPPRAGSAPSGPSPIYKIWLDKELHAFTYETVRTIKCDAARTAFAATGKGIVWAVADTGILGTHPHFAKHSNLNLPDGIGHRDFTQDHSTTADSAAAALIDQDGHGTHVAGIIAGELAASRRSTPMVTPALPMRRRINASRTREIRITRQKRIDENLTEDQVESRDAISGLAPECKLLSLKVLQRRKGGKVSALLAAVGYVQQLNENGRNIRVQGLNLSLGYTFDPEWFAAGQSPLCKEVDRLVKTGVVVVVAAGNGGYGVVTTQSGHAETAAHASTIADPGNAELAITVGSTHRDMPHAYGVSYFSAKGPTADGRMKPDIVAPGERIVSCALPPDAEEAGVSYYREDTGTSMAAPHVSAAIAAFLSVRREFIGKPERVKDIILASATDLRRAREFQGAGLIDLMRALQSV